MKKINKNLPKKEAKKELDRKSISDEINKILESFLLSKKSKKLDLEKILENSKEKIKKFKRLVPSESEYLFAHEKNEKEENIKLKYEFRKEERDEKDKNVAVNYRVNIDYQSNGSKEKVEAEVKFEDDNKNKGSYFVSIRQDKNDKKYFIDVRYIENKRDVSLSYIIPLQSYKEQQLEQKQDFTKLADKSLHIFPESVMGGVLGFTYIGENYMGRRADLSGAKARMVDTHEAIHTPDEYETRVLTDWMLSRPKINYKR